MSRGQGRVWRPESGYSGKQIGVYHADYTVDGTRYRESTGKTTRKEALAELEQRVQDRRNGKPVQPAKPTSLGAYAAAHLRFKQGKVSAQWHRALARYLDRAVVYFKPERPLRSVTPDDVVGWLEQLVEQGFHG